MAEPKEHPVFAFPSECAAVCAILGEERKHMSWNVPVKAGYGMIKNRLWSQTELNQALLLPSCVTSGKSFILSVHQFPHL